MGAHFRLTLLQPSRTAGLQRLLKNPFCRDVLYQGANLLAPQVAQNE
jgi:hypothetical protein